MYRSKTILLVEDTPEDVILLKRGFLKSGLNPRLQSVSGGEEAVDYLTGHGCFADRNQYPLPDLILLDLKMPRMNGFDVLKWLRQQSQLECIIVVALSTSTESQDVRRAYELRANSYVAKHRLLCGDGIQAMISLLHNYWFDLNICPPQNNSPIPAEAV